MISHFHLPSCLLLFCSSFSFTGSVYWVIKLPSPTVTVLQTTQVTFVFFHQVEFSAVLLNYSGCDCLLPIQIQLKLYFRTTQAQLCTTNSRATVYYSEFILLEFILLSLFSNYLATNILFLPLTYLILRLLSLELFLLSQNSLQRSLNFIF